MAELGDLEEQSGQVENESNAGGQDGGIPLVFLKESALFGQRRPSMNEWLKHEELYRAIGTVISVSHITGLQRVNGLWRIYLDNLDDKVTLMTQGVPLRGKTVPVLRTNPNRADGENTTRVRVKDVPLSADDDQIVRVLTLKGIDVISVYREKLRINGKLTNCATGDRILIARTLTLKEPLPRFMEFGQFKGKVIHQGQVVGEGAGQKRSVTCSKCLEEGHRFSQCENDWKCRACNNTGHKEADCKYYEIPSESPESSDTENEDEPDINNDVTHSETEVEKEKHEDLAEMSAKTPVRKSKSKKKAKANSGKQTSITSFVTMEDFTPDKRAPVVDRSPPTPAEQLHDNSKKTKL